MADGILTDVPRDLSVQRDAKEHVLASQAQTQKGWVIHKSQLSFKMLCVMRKRKKASLLIAASHILIMKA